MNTFSARCSLVALIAVSLLMTHVVASAAERGDEDVEAPRETRSSHVRSSREPDDGDVEFGRTVAAAPIRQVEEQAPVPAPIPVPMYRPRIAAPMQPAVVHVNESNFDAEVGSYNGPVLIDFYSRLCGPCKMLSPTIDGLAEEFRGRVKVVKIDSERESALVQRFSVNGLPCVIMQNGGNTVNRFVGVAPRDMLKGWMLAAK